MSANTTLESITFDQVCVIFLFQLDAAALLVTVFFSDGSTDNRCRARTRTKGFLVGHDVTQYSLLFVTYTHSDSAVVLDHLAFVFWVTLCAGRTWSGQRQETQWWTD